MAHLSDVHGLARFQATVSTRRSFLRMGGGAVGAVFLAACGVAAPGSSDATEKPTTKGAAMAELGREYLAYPSVKGVIQFSNCWGAARIPLVEQWIKDFTAIYPGIRIENDVADCPPLQQKQVAAIAGGAPPNVLMIKSDNTAFFAEQDALIPIDSLMSRDGIKADWFYPGELRSRTWAGKTYGLPNVTAGSLHLFYANTKLLQRIGWDPKKPIQTWQDLEALIEPAKKEGLFVMDPGKVSTGQTMHFVLTYANGGRYWDDNLTKILWNEPPAVEAAEWLLRFVKTQAGKYENLAIASDRKNAISSQDWGAEKYLTMVNLSSSFFSLQRTAPHVQYTTYTFPRNATNPESKGNTPSTGGWMFSLAKAGQDREAAWEWIKFTTVSKHACTFVKAQDRPSPVITCNEDPELALKNPHWPIVTKDLAAGISVPTTTVHPQFIQLWYEMEDAILLERMAPKAALDSFAARGQALLDDWNAKKKK